MLRRRAGNLEASRRIALLIVGGESPDWLAKLILDLVDGLAFRRGIDSLTPTRAELRTRLEKLREAAELIFDELHSPPVRDFLGWSAGPGGVSDEDLGRVLLEFVRRIDRAGKDKTLVDSAGRTKRGRGPARAATRPPPELAVAVVISEMWKYFRQEAPSPGSKKVAEVAEKFWRLAGGDAHDAGDEPLACWKSRFVEAAAGSSDERRLEAVGKLRMQTRRCLEAQGLTFIGETEDPAYREK